MGSREKDQPTPHLSSLVVRPTDSGGENGGGGAGSDYEPGEVRRDAPPYSRSDRFSDSHGGPPRSHGFGSGRDPGRHRDYSPPYGRGRHAGRFVGRSYDGPGYGARQVRGEGLPRSNPNVRPRDGDWMCTDPLYVLSLPYFLLALSCPLNVSHFFSSKLMVFLHCLKMLWYLC
ncbi:hypothetical protein AABB24_029916 [Solanum stoloniferum]|uniref:Uncharacterized protein n=1 Tax=Solanum stoloniferum TaxID=62892 RepID=A0ABD2S0R6_9SOLN